MPETEVDELSTPWSIRQGGDTGTGPYSRLIEFVRTAGSAGASLTISPGSILSWIQLTVSWIKVTRELSAVYHYI